MVHLVKVKYHAIRVEFQVRGSPHIHSFIWVIDAPILTKDNIGEYVVSLILLSNHMSQIPSKIQTSSS